MNVQERGLLSQFLQQLAQAQAGPKDAEAQALIDSAVARQPDASYLLVQRSLLQDNALQAAQAQIASLQAELQRAKPAVGGNFLDANAWGRAPVAPVYAPAAGVQQAPVYQQAPVAAAPSRFQAPSFLTGMATTAAGVVAGAFLFQGIESLMGHHGSGHQALAGGDALGGGLNASAFGLSDPAAPAPLLDSHDRDAPSDAAADTFSLDDSGAGSDDWA